MTADPADIIIKVVAGVVTGVIAPPGLSVQVRRYTMSGASPSVEESIARDENGVPCAVRWIVEPGAANADERA